jgi:hypothetical protein
MESDSDVDNWLELGTEIDFDIVAATVSTEQVIKGTPQT